MAQLENFKNINYQRLFANRRYLLAAAALTAFGALLILFVVLPQGKKIINLRDQIDVETKKLRLLQLKISSLRDAQVLQLVDNADLVDKVFPSYKPLLEFLAAVNNAARISRVKVEDVQLSPGLISGDSDIAANKKIKLEKRGDYKTLSLSLLISGSMARINSFLTQLERVGPLVNVSKITLRKQKSKESLMSEPQFEAELQLETYYFTKSIKSAVNTPLPKIGAEEINLIEELKTYVIAQPNLWPGIGAAGQLFDVQADYQLETID